MPLFGVDSFQMSQPGTLSFQNQQLKLDGEAEVEPVAQKIENFHSLKVLNLQGNTLGVQGGERLGRALAKHSELEQCLWSDMFTGRLKTEIPPILKSLCSAMIRANCQIKVLDLSDNAFGPIGADGIADFLVSPSAYSLETLRLNNNGLGAGGKIVAGCLIKCHRNAQRDGRKFALKHFIAGRNRLEDPGAVALSEAFTLLGTLEEIRVPQNGINVKGIRALASAVEKNNQLRIIDFNDNTCTEKGAIELAYAIPGLPNLEILDLGDSLCRDAGIASVVASISAQANPKLQTVNLSGNELCSETVDLIIRHFSKHDLKHVKVSVGANNVGSAFAETKATLKNPNIDLGDSDDDQGTLSPPESDQDSDEESDTDSSLVDELGAENESMEEGFSTDRTSSAAAAVLKKSQGDVDAQLDGMVENGFGCLKLAAGDDGSGDSDGVLSFLDRQMKINSAADAEPVAQKIERAKVVKTLELRGNTVGVEAGTRLAKALEKHPELEKCLWSDIFTGRLKTEIPPILQAMGSAMIRAQCHITELDLSDNAFGPIGAEGLKELLQSPVAYSLKVLKLNNNGLGSGGVVVAKCLAECHARSVAANMPLKLKTFIAGRNRLENPGAIALAETFKKLQSLEEIAIPQNGIQLPGVKALAEVLKFNKNLRIFNINDNTATQLGAYAIAQNLQYVPKLEILDLGDCLCRDAGCHSIVDSLVPKEHSRLRELNLSGSEMSSQAAELIIGKWKKFGDASPKLRIGCNNFGELFGEVRLKASQGNVDIGDSEDDCGSLSDDAAEYDSGSDGDVDESGDATEEDRAASANDDLIQQCQANIDKLDKEYESRVQDSSARVILQLSSVVSQSKDDLSVFNKAISLAEDVVKRVSSVSRQPIPTTTQLVNNCLAQAGFVKAEENWGLKIDRPSLGRLLKALLKRGQLERERNLIEHYFA